MSLIWFGGEPHDFPGSQLLSMRTTAGTYRSAYSRGGLYSSVNTFHKSLTFTPVTSAWLSVQCKCDNATSLAFGFGRTGASAGFLGVGYLGALTALAKYDGTTTTTLASEVSNTWSEYALVKFDLEVVNYGASATVRVYRNGTLIIEYTGDTTVTGVTNLDSVWLRGNSGNYFTYSEIMVADADTRLLSLATLAPNAAGDTNEWTGAYTAVDELGIDDSDVVSTSTADQTCLFNLTGMPVGDFIVKAVRVAARAADGVGGIGLKVGIKSNSTIDVEDAVDLGGYWQTCEYITQNNPITSNRFSPAEIDALQAALVSAAV